MRIENSNSIKTYGNDAAAKNKEPRAPNRKEGGEKSDRYDFNVSANVLKLFFQKAKEYNGVREDKINEAKGMMGNGKAVTGRDIVSKMLGEKNSD